MEPIISIKLLSRPPHKVTGFFKRSSLASTTSFPNTNHPPAALTTLETKQYAYGEMKD